LFVLYQHIKFISVVIGGYS